jgi:tetratricopeptide (TPR) repeat protein
MSQLSMGQPGDAVSNFRQVLQQQPADPDARLGLAQAYLGTGEREKAGETLEGMPRAADPRSHFAAGNLLAGMERYAAAAREFELAQSGYPNPYDAGFNLMLAYVKLRHFPDAVKTGERLVAEGHRQPELYNLLAQAYEGDGKTIQAYEALRTATNLDTADPANYLDLIALCLTHGNYDLALEIADIAVGRLPKSDRVRLQRGIVLAMKENFEGARAEFEKAVMLAPDASVPYVALALMLLQIDRPADAVALLRKRVETGGDYLSLWFLGEALNRAGPAAGAPEESEAIGVLTRSIDANPNVAQSHILLAKLLARRGEPDAAEKHLARALELDPENVSATYQLAQVYQKKGDTARAKELFAKVSKAKAEDREQFTRGGLQHIIRAGSK